MLMSLYFLALVRLLRITLVSQNNIVGYVPPSGHAISVLNHCSVVVYKFVNTHTTPDSGLT